MGRGRLIPLSRRELTWLREDVKDVIYDPNLRTAIKYVSQNRPAATGSGFTEDTTTIYTWGIFLEINVEEEIMRRDLGGEIGQKVIYVYAPDLRRVGVDPRAGDTITVTEGGTEYKFSVLRFSGPKDKDIFFRFIVSFQ